MLGEVLSPGREGAHAAVYSVLVLLGAHPPPRDDVGHPRATSSKEALSGEPSGTRSEASQPWSQGSQGNSRSLYCAFLLWPTDHPSPP